MSNQGIGYEKRHKARNRSRDELNEDKQTMMVKGPDGKMIECEIVATREHESIFMKNAPTLPLPLAIICCILNIIPGLGTFTGAFMSLCCTFQTSDDPPPKSSVFGISLMTACFQLILAPLVIGILWSIDYGVKLVRKSREAKYRQNQEELEDNDSDV